MRRRPVRIRRRRRPHGLPLGKVVIRPDMDGLVEDPQLRSPERPEPGVGDPMRESLGEPSLELGEITRGKSVCADLVQHRMTSSTASERCGFLEDSGCNNPSSWAGAATVVTQSRRGGGQGRDVIPLPAANPISDKTVLDSGQNSAERERVRLWRESDPTMPDGIPTLRFRDAVGADIGACVPPGRAPSCAASMRGNREQHRPRRSPCRSRT